MGQQLDMLLQHCPLQAKVYQQLPSLKRVFKRATRIEHGCQNNPSLVANCFGLDGREEVPFAAITGGLHKLPVKQGFWVRADPIFLKSDTAAVYCMGQTFDPYDAPSQKQLHDQINELLSLDGLVLHTPTEKDWYIQSWTEMDLQTNPLSSIIGKHIEDYLPKGDDQVYWRKLLTETQMACHQHDETQQRLAHDVPAINGLWFWGAGSLPLEMKSPYQLIMSNDSITQAFSSACKQESLPVPTHLDELLSQAKPDDHLLLSYDFDPLQIETNDSSAAKSLETNWFAPMLAALRTKRLDKVNLYFGVDDAITIERRDVARWWSKLFS